MARLGRLASPNVLALIRDFTDKFNVVIATPVCLR